MLVFHHLSVRENRWPFVYATGRAEELSARLYSETHIAPDLISSDTRMSDYVSELSDVIETECVFIGQPAILFLWKYDFTGRYYGFVVLKSDAKTVARLRTLSVEDIV